MVYSISNNRGTNQRDSTVAVELQYNQHKLGCFDLLRLHFAVDSLAAFSRVQ